MGRKGPKPKSPEELCAWRRDKRKADLKLMPKTGKLDRVEAPQCLSEEARKVWDQIVPELVLIGTMGAADVNAITRYCQQYVMWLAVKDTKLTDEGALAKMRIENNLSKSLLSVEREFGMTAASRANIKIYTSSNAHDAPPDEREKLFAP